MSHLTDDTLNEYLDDALDGVARQAVAAHLASCPTCHQTVAEMQNLFATLAQLPELPLSADLTGRVLAELPRNSPSARWPWAVTTVLATAVQVVVVLVMAGVLWPMLYAGLVRLSAAVSAAQPTWLNVWGVWEWWGAWGTAVYQQTQTLSLALNLPTAQWGILLAGALLLWLIGNRLLLKP